MSDERIAHDDLATLILLMMLYKNQSFGTSNPYALAKQAHTLADAMEQESATRKKP